jgi:hypothetical protein
MAPSWLNELGNVCFSVNAFYVRIIFSCCVLCTDEFMLLWKKGEGIISLGEKVLNDKDRRVQVGSNSPSISIEKSLQVNKEMTTFQRIC